ncbi:MAG: 3-deoxy-manno-octulosonate cytidylyltransferase [Candidatus Hydrogenedentes bacterium]|nr:3-deoxy-manno-octulosonate cytidylyltransferase [Candidatus Hydrogenedentota bacterium]
MSSGAGRTILAVIPARFASTRFPGKVIAPLAGKPLVAHTYERACRSALVSDVVVATDDHRVVDALAPYGVQVVMTRPDHPSGTDRIAEVAETRRADIIVNVQGDEPLIDPGTIDAAIGPLLEDPELPMGTARRLIAEPETARDPNVVKVVCDGHGRALYFSRSMIPYIREVADRETNPPCYWQHIGLYVYRREFLLEYARWPQTPLERLEKLEQLRVLENGYPIAVVDTEYESIGVDTPADLERVRGIIEHALEERT